ncbi:MAG: hypothetical protein AAB458_01735 [Patescibacteria group bacterium]
MAKRRETVRQLARDTSIIVGVVLVWRGIWYTLDAVDRVAFNGNHDFLAIGGIIIGLLVLYLPDKDLKEFKEL